MRLNATIHVKHGFSIYALRNDCVEVAAVPELGARIISLKNVKTGREWMWRPPGKLKLFRNQSGDDFSRSPLVGMDECLPTIAPCRWRGRALPDHGEVWSAPWEVDDQAWERGELRVSTTLKISPFDFERTIQLRGGEISIEYKLRNRGPREEQFLWALHPLLKLRRGDRLMLPKSSRALLNGEAWNEELNAVMPDGHCEKLFVSPVVDGGAGIHNQITGDRFDLEWRPAENNTLGLWLTRGGWHGHHHFAIEPSNGDADALKQAAARKRCGVVKPGGSATWRLRFCIGP
jgi:hypothetical protein